MLLGMLMSFPTVKTLDILKVIFCFYHKDVITLNPPELLPPKTKDFEFSFFPFYLIFTCIFCFKDLNFSGF